MEDSYSLWDAIEAEADRLERLVAGELPDDDWYDFEDA